MSTLTHLAVSCETARGRQVAAAGWRDMRVTDLERADLLAVAALPGVSADGVLAIREGQDPREI